MDALRDYYDESIFITDGDGTYQQFVIDSRGYFHVAAEVYKFAGDMEKTCQELDEVLVSWSDEV